MTTLLPTNLGEKSPENLVDELTYQNFRHNVTKNPQISLARWNSVYGAQTLHIIQRFQTEISQN